MASTARAAPYKVRHDGKVVTRVLYSVIGLSLSGKKQVLGIYTAESDRDGGPFG